jgi:signal transduction histidine kinase
MAERELVQAKLVSGRLILKAVGQKLAYIPDSPHKNLLDFKTDRHFKKSVLDLLETGGFQAALFVNKQGDSIFSIHTKGVPEDALVAPLFIIYRTLETGNCLSELCGKTWGIIWPAPKTMNLSAPLLLANRPIGAAIIFCNLDLTYEALRKSERLILVYILFNTVIFALIGTYLISRSVVAPVRRLLRATEEFKDQGPLPSLADSSKNEIGQLSRSLNMMLRRLEENKKELKDHIFSLEKANQDLKLAQDEIVRAEKMASVGRLSSGVAHEIGNPVTIILGYLELLKMSCDDNLENSDFLERIESELTRIRQTLKQLADFSRPSNNEISRVDLHELIAETVDMLKPQLIKYRIEFEIRLDASEYNVYSDLTQLRQVFMNISMNAIDALKDNKISGEENHISKLVVRTLNYDNMIEIRFSDTGPGIPAEDLLHVFDPFYTTKEAGQGPGLGLWVCHRIMEGLGGSIKAKSIPEGGLVLILIIPLNEIDGNHNERAEITE